MCQLAKDHQDESTDTPKLVGLKSKPEFSTLDSLPQNPLCQKAFDFAYSHLHPSIFNHSIRVYLHAKQLASQEKSPLPTSTDAETLLFVAAMFHDMGTSAEFDGPERFEVCGADGAVAFLKEHAPEIPASDAHDVWIAIACHTSPEVAERISPFSKTVRLAILVDFDRPGLRLEHGLEPLAHDLETRFPRLDIEKVLGDSVIGFIMLREEGEQRLRKAPNNSWPGSLLKGELEREEGDQGVNRYF